MNNWKELKDGLGEVFKEKLQIQLYKTYIGDGKYQKNLDVRILHPCVDPCEEELLVFQDNESKYTSPWIHYSEKVEADLDEFIGIKLAEQREREELEKLSSEERARLEKEKVSRILDSY